MKKFLIAGVLFSVSCFTFGLGISAGFGFDYSPNR